MNEPDVFPEELVFLLRNEEKNINNLKEKIEREKSRVENDFAVFRA
jgi:predicted transcriptional regulator